MKKFINKLSIKLSLTVFLGLAGMLIVWAYLKQPEVNEITTSTIGMAVKEDLIQRVTIAGTIVPAKKTFVTAPYNGYVKKVFVKTGDLVKKGDPIVSIVQSLQSSEDVFPLRAPFDGTVVQVAKSDGEFVREGDKNDFMMRIDDLSQLYVVANAPEMDRVKVKVGQEAIIKASAVLDRTFKGVIEELSLAAREKDDWSRTQVVEFPIRIRMVEVNEQVKSGMSVVVDVVTNRRDNVITLRHEFVHRDKDRFFVVLENGQQKDIKVGLQNENAFEVLEGLQADQKLKQVDFSKLEVSE
jgi:multidrug efflux pump subunit AcrA (membrane-fusion protein)